MKQNQTKREIAPSGIIGARLKAARENAGISIAHAAKVLDVDPDTITKWEKGLLPHNGTQAAELGELVGLSPNQLFHAKPIKDLEKKLLNKEDYENVLRFANCIIEANQLTTRRPRFSTMIADGIEGMLDSFRPDNPHRKRRKNRSV